MPTIPSILSVPVRRGVTLLELLVVLVLLSVAAALVVPRFSALPRVGGEATGDTAALIERARRTAIRRGAPVRLRLAADGAWALVSARDGEVLGGGRLPANGAGNSVDAALIDLQIDAMGSCLPGRATDDGAPAAGQRAASAPRAFDALSCRLRVTTP